MVYKIDWFPFTVSDEINKNGENIGFILLESLRYYLAEFETIPGRYFYNSGLLLGGLEIFFKTTKERDLAEIRLIIVN